MLGRTDFFLMIPRPRDHKIASGTDAGIGNDRFRIGGVGKCKVQSEAAQHFVKQAERAAIYIIACQHM